MLATGTTLGCGLSICLAVFPADVQATEPPPAPPAVYRFENWTVEVHSAPSATVNATAPRRLSIEEQASRIELTSFQPIPPAPHPADESLLPAAPVDAVLINPEAAALPETPPATLPCPTTSTDGISRAEAYRAIYDSIPFSRAEYEANPSYRHDAAMELLFGQMRPTVIHRQQRTRVDINMPAQPFSGAGLQFNRYGIYNRWSPYMYPPYRW